MADPVDITLKLYQIHRCGFYPRSKDVPPETGVARFFQEVNAWRRLQGGTTHTCPFPTNASDHPIFCAYMTNADADGSFVLTLWNTLPKNSKNIVAALSPKSKADSPKFKTKKFPLDTFPGYPTYYWIVPKHGFLYTIKIGDSLCKVKPLEKYMNEFLGRQSSFCEKSHGKDGDVIIYRYTKPDGGEETVRYLPHFTTKSWINRAAINDIARNRINTTKIIRKEDVVSGGATSRLSKLTNLLGLTSTIPDGTRNVRLELEHKPSRKELRELYNIWKGDKSIDFGFRFNDGKELWFSHSLAIYEYGDIRIKENAPSVFSATSISDFIQKVKSRIITDSLKKI